MENTHLSQAVQFIFSGLTSGAIYALAALGFNIIYNVTLVVNLAQGEFLMLGAMTMISLYSGLKLPLPLALALSTLIVGCVGILFDRFAIRPLKKPKPLELVIITIGGSILIRGLAMLVWGKDTHSLPAFTGSEPLEIGTATILPQHLWILGLTCLAILLNKVFFQYTITGKAMRACAVNRRAASLVGIDVRRMVLFSFIISSALGSLAGIIVAPLTMTAYDVGIMLGLKGFCAAIIGGMSSGLGTVIGGLILGCWYLHVAFRPAIAVPPDETNCVGSPTPMPRTNDALMAVPPDLII